MLCKSFDQAIKMMVLMKLLMMLIKMMPIKIKDYKDDLRNTSERLFSVLVAFSLAGLEDLVRSCLSFEIFLIFNLFFGFYCALYLYRHHGDGEAPRPYTLR